MYGGRREVYTGFLWGNLREKERPLRRRRRRWVDNIKVDFQEMGLGGGGAWSEFICLGIGPGFGHL